ncbi:GerAB/ArcD/ProY family transporter [Alkalihalophilus lindianensis]|uniref:GerAB/ArcD/ProY family transporter n=1 Tax=Alkalihalophilus lindianensis TaxID=1630542 RepID=A0ABU3X5Z5_9BACI|nr:GerAB/ArcD/ProY family transporter [Alkalihalophilus lindianensis]MDV2683218.1 GerAB/ArcD/ProY family transporter [Alkalihalophilus lindianensis]
MDTNPISKTPKAALMIPPYLVFYLIHSMQVGVGVLGFTRYIGEIAGYRAWMAVLLTGVLFHIVVWVMYQILNEKDKDIVSVHRHAFGKWIGGFFTFIFIIYITFLAMTVLRTYVEVVQIWIFSDLPTWAMSLSVILVAYYAITSGFRVVAGVCFLGVVVPFFLFLSAIAPLEFATFRNLLPLFDTTLSSQIEATKAMTLSFLGPELLLVFYPFIQEPRKSQKYAHFAIMFTTFIYLTVTLITFVFYSEKQLATTIWPTLSAWKVLELPFIERFEYLGIATWMFVVMPNITLGLWGASRALKRQINISHRKSIIAISVIAFIVSINFTTRAEVDFLNTNVSKTGMYIAFFYLPLLALILYVRRKINK